MKRAIKSGKTAGWFLLILAIGWVGSVGAQESNRKVYPLTLSVFNNATLLPGQGLGTPVHPGIVGGTEFRYNGSLRHEWFQTVKVGYFYHRYVQHGFQLYSEVGYRRHFASSFDLESRLGAGYLHSVTAARVFELSPDGVYVRQRSAGRPQAMISLVLGGGYTFQNEFRVFLAYQFYLQAPFVKEYVPMLPNTALHAGVSFPFFTSNKQP